jgi:hypothetical protein
MKVINNLGQRYTFLNNVSTAKAMPFIDCILVAFLLARCIPAFDYSAPVISHFAASLACFHSFDLVD